MTIEYSADNRARPLSGKKTTLQIVQKMGLLLDLFTVERPDWGAAEVGLTLNVPKSSAHSMLSSLSEIGLLQCHGRGRYRIGWRVVELGETQRAATDVRTFAAPVLRDLHDRFSETVHLAVLSRGKVLYLDKIVGTHMLNITGARVGALVDPHCTGTGKVLLAGLDPCEARRVLDTASPLRRYTAATVIDPVVVMRELHDVHAAGCAFDHGEITPDVHCVAAPVKDDLGLVIAAVSITVPANRFHARRPEFRRACIAAAASVSQRIRTAAAARAAVAEGVFLAAT